MRPRAGPVVDHRQEFCGDFQPCFNAQSPGQTSSWIDFGQDSAWRPSESTAQGRWAATARWAFIGVRWVLTSVFVAAFTRRVQRD